MGQAMISYRGKTPPGWVLSGVNRGEIAAICLFSYNIDGPAQLRDTTTALYSAAEAGGQPPPLIGIDQEGGQLMAVTGGVTELPGNMALGAAGSPELAFQAGRVLGLELLAMGCNLDFAPVLDLAGDFASQVVGIRSFGDDPQSVARLGTAMIAGMQSAGVIATGKHFPGHGATPLDSHHESPLVSRSRQQLDESELVPFREAVAAGVKAMMSAHVRYPALDEAPATLSGAILTGLLREELGFRGLIITDAMDMEAVAGLPARESIEQAAAAGADLVLLGHLPDQQELHALLSSRPGGRSRARVERLRGELPRTLPPLAQLGCEEHREIAQRIADLAVTLLPGSVPVPLGLDGDEELALVSVRAGNLTPADTSHAVELQLAEQLRSRHSRVMEIELAYDSPPSELERVVASLQGARVVIIATVNAIHDPVQSQLLQRVAGHGKEAVHIAMRSPADITLSPEGTTRICTYGIRSCNTEAAVRLLCGEIQARGKLPISLTGAGSQPIASEGD